jgi:N6-adenosine-specific RNA methylase IME4
MAKLSKPKDAKKREALKQRALNQLDRFHRNAVAKAVPTIKEALAILDALERQIDSAKTYAALQGIIREALALKVLLGRVVEVKQKSEKVVIIANWRIGKEIQTGVPKERGPGGVKGTRTAFTSAGKSSGRGAIGIPGTSRSRILKLAGQDKERVLELAYELWAAGKDATVLGILHELKNDSLVEKRKEYQARAERGSPMVKLADLIKAGTKFPVIYVDAPWTFNTYSDRGKERSPERHYRVMTLDQIKAMPVNQLATKNCVMFFWGVWPELQGALDVIKAWGFEYKTAGFVWVKQNRNGEGLFTGMGYWTRSNTEFCLLATIGKPERMAKDVHQVIMSPVGKHSEKPEEARKRIEKLFIGPYLELFARGGSEGWQAWGDEAEVTKEAAE